MVACLEKKAIWTQRTTAVAPPQPNLRLRSLLSLLRHLMSPSTPRRPEPSWIDIAPELMLSLATGPLLLAVLGTKAMAQLIQEVGQMSEEVFRGDRLPTLDVSISQPSPSNQVE